MVLGNGVALFFFIQERRVLKITHKFIISMAFNDFLTGCITVPLIIYRLEARINGQSPQCASVLAILATSYQVSLYITTASTIDRFWAIVYPVNYRNNMTHEKANFIILLSWAIPCFLGSIHILTNVRPDYEEIACFMSKYVIAKPLLDVFMASTAINLILIIVLYSFIQRSLCNFFKSKGPKGYFAQAHHIFRHKFDKNELKTMGHEEKKMAREMRGTILVLMIVTGSVISFLPHLISVVVNQINPRSFQMEARLWINLALTFNSAFNPILYAFNISFIRERAKNYRNTLIAKNLSPKEIQCFPSSSAIEDESSFNEIYKK